MTPRQVSLPEAERAYAVANTPSFLLRKLQDDAAVRGLEAKFGGEVLLKALKAAVIKRPRTIGDMVRPYAYLVALAYSADMAHLTEAAKLEAPHHEWYSAIAKRVLETYNPVQYNVLRVPLRQHEPSATYSASSAYAYPQRGDV